MISGAFTQRLPPLSLHWHPTQVNPKGCFMNRRHFVSLLGLSTLALGCAGPGRFVPEPTHGFVARQISTPQGPHRFFVYKPRHVGTQEKLPVILYLHGGGERGEDGVAPTQVGLGQVVQAALGYFPFLVVFPQCKSGGFWGAPDMAARAMQALAVAIHDFGGDPERVYVTGNSLGGYGTYLLASRYPGQFAALAPICGGVKPPPLVSVPKGDSLFDLNGDVYAQLAERLGRTPVWIFHGESDPLVPPKISVKIAQALREHAGRREPGLTQLTIWPGVGHTAEEPTYNMPQLFDWFLQHRLKSATDVGNTALR